MRNMIIRKRKASFSLGKDRLSAWSFISFFAMPFIKTIIQMFVSGISTPVAIVITYLPVILILLIEYRKIPLDFLLLLSGVAFFYAATYLIHPEYEYYFNRSYYGAWDYVFRFDNGIYTYLFLRLVNDPKKILKYLRISAWLMYVHLGMQLMEALNRGYWISTMEGVTKHVYYSLDFGYDVLLYDLVFLYLAFKNKRISDMVGAVLGIVMIMVGGSRGPILDIAIFVLIYVSLNFIHSKKKAVYILLLIVLVPLFLFVYIDILTYIADVLEGLGISSRFIRTILENRVTDDNGRMVIWLRALDMIRNNPFGYGAMGARHGIYHIIAVGHPHNVFLEILIDFGVIFGTAIIVFFLINSVRILMRKDIDDWRGVFMIFFAQSCQLLLSGTYWHRGGIWSALAVGVCIHYHDKRVNKMRRQKRLG